MIEKIKKYRKYPTLAAADWPRLEPGRLICNLLSRKAVLRQLIICNASRMALGIGHLGFATLRRWKFPRFVHSQTYIPINKLKMNFKKAFV